MRVAPQFTLENVERRWGNRIALTGIDLCIEPGERVALVGPSGSGKTTLLRLLMGALRCTKGTVRADGISVNDMSPKHLRCHRLRCALVDQGAEVLERTTVHNNVMAGIVPSWPWWRVLASMLFSLEQEQVHSLLDAVALGERQWDLAGQLSGGQRQRVSIARALAGEPSVLLADEPTGALDPNTAAEVMVLLAKETANFQATFIVSTHRVSRVLKHVDRVIGLRNGTVFLDQSTKLTTEADLDRLYEGSSERT